MIMVGLPVEGNHGQMLHVSVKQTHKILGDLSADWTNYMQLLHETK